MSENTAKAQPAKAEAKPAPLTYRDREYTGPLTGEQAAWRNANLKPVDDDKSKPGRTVTTK